MAVTRERLCNSRSCSAAPVEYFPPRAVRGLAIAQIAFGIVVIIAQIVVLSVYNLFFNHISQGIWCGLAFIVCGAFGIVSGKFRTVPWIVTHLILCILICVFSAAIIVLSALTAVYYFGSMYTYQYRPCPGNNGFPMFYGTGFTGPGYYNSPNMEGYENDFWGLYYSAGTPVQAYMGQGKGQPCFGHYVISIPWVVQFTMNMLLGCLGIINAIVSIVAATLSCGPVCCYNRKKEDEDKENLIDCFGSEILTVVPPPYSEKPSVDDQQVDVEAPGAPAHI